MVSARVRLVFLVSASPTFVFVSVIIRVSLFRCLQNFFILRLMPHFFWRFSLVFFLLLSQFSCLKARVVPKSGSLTLNIDPRSTECFFEEVAGRGVIEIQFEVSVSSFLDAFVSLSSGFILVCLFVCFCVCCPLDRSSKAAFWTSNCKF